MAENAQTQRQPEAGQAEAKPDPPSATAGPELLDLAFGMDCTASMGSYIGQAQQNIRKIVEEIVSKEKADVRLALVEYRDHPPQDRTFVTRVHDFTNSVRDMKSWLDQCSAQGGGDMPEAVADGLHQVLKLNWRAEATKICVFISDAPPHGLGNYYGDGFPKGCPDGLDPMVVTQELAEKGVTLYMVGCEPSINSYKDFFVALAQLTGGQYVPLRKASVLAQVIIGGAQEELSLQRLMDEINEEVTMELNAGTEDASISRGEFIEKIHAKVASKGYRTKHLTRNKASLAAEVTDQSRMLSNCSNMEEVRSKYKSHDDENSRMSAMSFSSTESHSRSRKMKKAPNKSTTPTSFLGRIFGRSEPQPEENRSSDENVTEGAISAPPTEAVQCRSMDEDEESYDVAEDLLDLHQTERMVQKSIMSNKLHSKIKK